MIFFSILILFILCIVFTRSECFELNQHSVKINENKQTELLIQGVGNICDCYNDELQQYRESIESIVFNNSITSGFKYE